MAPCKFWAQGNCRNGNNCRFEHGPVNGGQYSSNRFAPLQNQSQQNSSRNRQGNQSRELPFSLDKESIIVDLSSERPQWILSAYGPGRFAPAQLFGGPQREQSFEEMRLQHYLGVAAGNPERAIQDANQKYQAAEQQMQTALNNIDGALNYIVDAQNEHPNRVDIVGQSTSGGGGSNPFAKPASQGAFGAPSQTSTGVFGQATQTKNPFGAPSQPSPNPFGAPSQPAQQSTFGAPSQPGAFGAPSSGAFGQPSALGQKPNPFGAPSAPAFGGPSQLGRTAGGFGQPSALGQKPNPFGTPAPGASNAPGGFAAFAGSGAFGAPSQPVAPSPFTNQPQPTPAFGAPSHPNPQPNAFGQPAFGAPSPAPKNPFGSATQPPAANNPFGQPSAQTQPNPFGTSSQPGSFGQPSPFGSSAVTSKPNPFGMPSNSQQAISNPFGQVNGQTSNAFAAGSSGGKPGAYLPQGSGGNEISSYASRDGSGRLSMFKGRRVQYQDDEPGYIGQDGQWSRIFFPDGPPAHQIKTTTNPNDQYDAATEAAYRQLLETGSFPEDNIPLLPPKREWIRWDF